MKTCSMCGQTKPLEAFHRGKSPDGRQVWCKPCRKVYDRSYHRETRAIRVEQKRIWKAETLAWVRTLKQRPCTDCGGTFHPVAMHFDHRPGVEKKFEIGFGVRRYSKNRLLAEIAKCDLVCANCHAVRTHRRQSGA